MMGKKIVQISTRFLGCNAIDWLGFLLHRLIRAVKNKYYMIRNLKITPENRSHRTSPSHWMTWLHLTIYIIQSDSICHRQF